MCIHLYVYTCVYISILIVYLLEVARYIGVDMFEDIYVYDDDDVYLRLQHGKGFHNLVYVLRKRHKPSILGISNDHNNSKHLCNNLMYKYK
jgi:hypothetical protein